MNRTQKSAWFGLVVPCFPVGWYFCVGTLTQNLLLTIVPMVVFLLIAPVAMFVLATGIVPSMFVLRAGTAPPMFILMTGTSNMNTDINTPHHAPFCVLFIFISPAVLG